MNGTPSCRKKASSRIGSTLDGVDKASISPFFLIKTHGHMETEPSDPQAAACPRWVMLSRHSDRRAIADDAKATSAASHTSSGHLLHVSFPLTSPPPACSTLYHDWPHIADPAARIQGPQIVASHGDCLLLDVTSGDPDRWRDTVVTDYFLYEAATVTGKKKHDDEDLDPSPLWSDYTGILLRRGDGEVVVARLEEIDQEVPIIHGESTAGQAQELMQWWKTDEAVPVGDRFLCFVDYLRGFLLCDMAAAAAHQELRYVPLPLEESPNRFPGFYDDERPTTQMFRNLAAVSATAVSFVTVDRRCCCGGHGVSTCERGKFLFKVTIWTLSLTTDDDEPPATWVMDSELDCEELWAMPGYGSVPRTERLMFPVVRCDDPDVVCFVVHSPYRYSINMGREDRKVWVLEIDMGSKELRSVTVYDNSDRQAEYQDLKGSD
ncbi:hypothetical protein HU200_007734 [Digitaria exilis]|uniref:DUF1618 domain-containing protein n=1 Tax=Digitaria exilis TaxID=1010633 RepID=A0A835FMR3_9POAL|nr:hypothetical protein HU200_007734 [Digitaria exilis]